MVFIYRETKNNVQPENGWEFWGKRKTESDVFYVWRKEVSQEEAEQYELEKSMD